MPKPSVLKKYIDQLNRKNRQVLLFGSRIWSFDWRFPFAHREEPRYILYRVPISGPKNQYHAKNPLYHYLLVDRKQKALGKGSFGEIHRVFELDPETGNMGNNNRQLPHPSDKHGRQWVVKLLSYNTASSPYALNHRHELSLQFALNTTTKAPIQYAQPDGTQVTAIISDYIVGADPEKIQPASWVDSFTQLLQLALQLEEAHKKGILHRDLTPRNISSNSEWGARIFDWGIGEALTLEADHTPGTCYHSRLFENAGTDLYMAPENIKHGDQNSQIISLNSDTHVFTLFFILFLGGNEEETMQQRKKIFSTKAAAVPYNTPKDFFELPNFPKDCICPKHTLKQLCTGIIIPRMQHSDPKQRYSSSDLVLLFQSFRNLFQAANKPGNEDYQYVQLAKILLTGMQEWRSHIADAFCFKHLDFESHPGFCRAVYRLYQHGLLNSDNLKCLFTQTLVNSKSVYTPNDTFCWAVSMASSKEQAQRILAQFNTEDKKYDPTGLFSMNPHQRLSYLLRVSDKATTQLWKISLLLTQHQDGLKQAFGQDAFNNIQNEVTNKMTANIERVADIISQHFLEYCRAGIKQQHNSEGIVNLEGRRAKMKQRIREEERQAAMKQHIIEHHKNNPEVILYLCESRHPAVNELLLTPKDLLGSINFLTYDAELIEMCRILEEKADTLQSLFTKEHYNAVFSHVQTARNTFCQWFSDRLASIAGIITKEKETTLKPSRDYFYSWAEVLHFRSISEDPLRFQASYLLLLSPEQVKNYAQQFIPGDSKEKVIVYLQNNQSHLEAVFGKARYYQVLGQLDGSHQQLADCKTMPESKIEKPDNKNIAQLIEKHIASLYRIIDPSIVNANKIFETITDQQVEYLQESNKRNKGSDPIAELMLISDNLKAMERYFRHLKEYDREKLDIINQYLQEANKDPTKKAIFSAAHYDFIQENIAAAMLPAEEAQITQSQGTTQMMRR